ncbi:MAG: adenylate/guanylate cyclase domain-containing protein [Spirochaetota bacterium]
MKHKTEELFSPALRNDLRELIAGSFSSDGVDELGCLLFRAYSSHSIAGADNHITISRQRAAGMLIEHAESHGKLSDLIKLIAELDGRTFMGKRLDIRDIEVFFNSLARVGIVYDPSRRRLHHSREDVERLKNWGSLRDGRAYQIAVVSADIVGNSRLVREHGNRVMEKLYFALWRFLEHKLDDYDGRIWNWAGDGGLLAFTFDGAVDRAVMCAIDIQSSIPLFNIAPDTPINDRVELRLGVDTGEITFYSETGRIVSDVINYAAHLEKAATLPGHVSLSERAKAACDDRILTIFEDAGEFEGFPYCTTSDRLDALFSDPDGCADPAPGLPASAAGR